jgi:hypothetical protein
MAKSFSTTRPEKVARYDHSHVLLSYNIVEVEATEDREAGFEFDTLIVTKAEKNIIISALIRERYTVDDEFAILRQRDTKPDEFAEYNNFAEACKAEANSIIGSLEG